MRVEKENFIALTDCTDRLEQVKDIQHKYRDNHLIVELCKSIQNIVDEAVVYSREREIDADNQISELESEKDTLEDEVNELEEKISDFESLLDDIENAENLTEVKKLIKEFK